MPPKVLNHFKKSDPLLYQLIQNLDGKMQTLQNRKGDNYFLDLVDSIISQQLSGKVANVIFERFINLFPAKKVTPQAVLKLRDDKIRKVGISYSKINYIKDLAQNVDSGKLNLKSLSLKKDEEILAELTKVKGIGKWTAEMFLIFTLKREDVFSHGDLGLNNAIKKIYKLKNYKKDSVEKIVEKWSPYKSYASRVLWKSLDNR